MKNVKHLLYVGIIGLMFYYSENSVAFPQADVLFCVHADHSTDIFERYHILTSNQDVWQCPDPDAHGIHVKSTAIYYKNIILNDPECILVEVINDQN